MPAISPRMTEQLLPSSTLPRPPIYHPVCSGFFSAFGNGRRPAVPAGSVCTTSCRGGGPKESADGPAQVAAIPRPGPPGRKHTHEHRRIGPTRAVDPPGPSGSHVNRPTTRRIGKKRCGGRAPLPGPGTSPSPPSGGGPGWGAVAPPSARVGPGSLALRPTAVGIPRSPRR